MTYTVSAFTVVTVLTQATTSATVKPQKANGTSVTIRRLVRQPRMKHYSRKPTYYSIKNAP